MGITEQVKRAVGIFYSDPDTDAFIETLIEQAQDDLRSSGVPEDKLGAPLAQRAIVMFCKGSYPTEDSKDLTTTLAYVAMLTKLRA